MAGGTGIGGSRVRTGSQEGKRNKGKLFTARGSNQRGGDKKVKHEDSLKRSLKR